MELQAKWVRMLLNNGVDPVTKATVVPELVLAEVTTAHTIVNPRAPSSELSISGYGMGWMRQSYRGHEVCLNARFKAVLLTG